MKHNELTVSIPDCPCFAFGGPRCPLPGVSEPGAPAASLAPIQSAPVECSPSVAIGQHCSQDDP